MSIAEFRRWQAKIHKLVKRAERKGFPGTVTLSGERVVVENDGRFDPAPRAAKLVVVNARISGVAPCYGDWRLLAALDAVDTSDDEGVAWVVRYVPGAEAMGTVDRGRLRPGWCDHCRTTRTRRRRLVAVQHIDTGEVRQIGSTCLRDYLGWSLAPVFLTADEVTAELERFGGPVDAFTPNTVVAAAIAAVKASGWTSRTMARERGRPATADLVGDYLMGRGQAAHDAAELIDPYIDEATAAAAEVVAVVLTEWDDAEDGYAANLCSALRGDSR